MKGTLMASKFEVSPEWNGDVLHLRLSGEFDKDSACNLIDVLQEKCNRAAVIYVQGKGLTRITPEGRSTFQRNLHVLNDLRYRLVFPDVNAARIGPEGIDFF